MNLKESARLGWAGVLQVVNNLGGAMFNIPQNRHCVNLAGTQWAFGGRLQGGGG